ncbi:MAG: thioredoxin family protein [Saprospiraceae bacterium]|nr:thioredoxin family protein [Saprospiraceae bacterium]
MKAVLKYKYVYFFLLGIWSLQACNKQPADGKESATNNPSSSTYASDKEGWLVNLNDAYALSEKEKKPVLIYFTSSDTCGMCQQLEANVFSTPVFKSWAEKKIVMFKVDFATHHQFPEGKQEQNAAMAQSLKITTCPALWMLSVTHEVENGRFKVKPIGKVGYAKTPEEFIGMVQNFLRR